MVCRLRSPGLHSEGQKISIKTYFSLPLLLIHSCGACLRCSASEDSRSGLEPILTGWCERHSRMALAVCCDCEAFMHGHPLCVSSQAIEHTICAVLRRRRRRRKFNTSIEPAVAYENESVFMSGPVQQRPAIVHRHPLGPCAKPKTSWHQMHPETAPHVCSDSEQPMKFCCCSSPHSFRSEAIWKATGAQLQNSA